MAQHRAAQAGRTARHAVVAVALILGALWVIGHHAQQAQAPAWPHATDTLYVCTEEDGSEPGQPFPCLWDAAEHGNHSGQSYVLDQAQGVWPT